MIVLLSQLFVDVVTQLFLLLLSHQTTSFGLGGCIGGIGLEMISVVWSCKYKIEEISIDVHAMTLWYIIAATVPLAGGGAINSVIKKCVFRSGMTEDCRKIITVVLPWRPAAGRFKNSRRRADERRALWQGVLKGIPIQKRL